MKIGAVSRCHATRQTNGLADVIAGLERGIERDAAPGCPIEFRIVDVQRGLERRCSQWTDRRDEINSALGRRVKRRDAVPADDSGLVRIFDPTSEEVLVVHLSLREQSIARHDDGGALPV
jgi:hypothetical protein